MIGAISVLADAAGSDSHHMWGDGAIGWVWGTVMMLVMVGLVAVLIVWLLRGGIRAPLPPRADPTLEARSILANRLASGEITAEEYRERLSHLD